MATVTVQSQLARLAQRIDPQTKLGQSIQDNSAAFVITNATNATPIVITAANHGLQTNQSVYITGVVGNTAANNTLSNPSWIVTVIDANTFSLNGSIGNGAYTSGGTGVGALAGSVDGSVFKRQRLLDIYNDARLVLLATSKEFYLDPNEAIDYSGILILKSDFTFAAGIAPKPLNYIDAVFLTDVNFSDIDILPLQAARLVAPYESATNRFVFELGLNVQTLSGNTFVPDAATYKLGYIGLALFTMTDVLGGTTLESYDDDFLQIILEIAQAIADEQGTKDLNALTRKLLEIKSKPQRAA